MKSESFAEILKEKIEKTKNTEANKPFSTSSDSEINPKWTTADTLHLSRFQTRLFEQTPQSFQNSFTGQVHQTPYSQFRRPSQNLKSRSESQFQPNVKQKPSEVSTEEIKPTLRVRTAAHKLNEKQTLSMTYFINEKMFLLDDFTIDELKKAYKKLALKKHPDRHNGSSEVFIELNAHYEILCTVPKK